MFKEIENSLSKIALEINEIKDLIKQTEQEINNVILEINKDHKSE